MSEEEFPRMIYHIAEDPKIVYSENEFKAHLGRGWLPTKNEYAEAEALRAKIEYYQEQIVECNKKLFELSKMKDRRLSNYIAPVEEPISESSPEIKEEVKPKKEKKEVKKRKERPQLLPEDYKYECAECGKKFAYAVALSQHKKKCPKPNEEPK